MSAVTSTNSASILTLPPSRRKSDSLHAHPIHHFAAANSRNQQNHYHHSHRPHHHNQQQHLQQNGHPHHFRLPDKMSGVIPLKSVLPNRRTSGAGNAGNAGNAGDSAGDDDGGGVAQNNSDAPSNTNKKKMSGRDEWSKFRGPVPAVFRSALQHTELLMGGPSGDAAAAATAAAGAAGKPYAINSLPRTNTRNSGSSPAAGYYSSFGSRKFPSLRNTTPTRSSSGTGSANGARADITVSSKSSAKVAVNTSLTSNRQHPPPASMGFAQNVQNGLPNSVNGDQPENGAAACLTNSSLPRSRQEDAISTEQPAIASTTEQSITTSTTATISKQSSHQTQKSTAVIKLSSPATLNSPPIRPQNPKEGNTGVTGAQNSQQKQSSVIKSKLKHPLIKQAFSSSSEASELPRDDRLKSAAGPFIRQKANR